jgi:hypothetical protein
LLTRRHNFRDHGDEPVGDLDPVAVVLPRRASQKRIHSPALLPFRTRTQITSMKLEDAILTLSLFEVGGQNGEALHSMKTRGIDMTRIFTQ